MATYPLGPGWGQGFWGQGTWGSAPIGSLPIAYYLNLYTSEYRLSTNLLAFTSLQLGPLQDINQCLQSFSSAFSLNYATGVQLNALGAIAGVSRTVPFQPSNSVSPVLDDPTYRILIQATIARNQWDGTLGSLQGIWQSIFPGGNIAIVDNMNMTATVLLAGTFFSIIIDLIENDMLVPRPQAVKYTYTIVASYPLLGFDQTTAYVAGFDDAHWT